MREEGSARPRIPKIRGPNRSALPIARPVPQFMGLFLCHIQVIVNIIVYRMLFFWEKLCGITCFVIGLISVYSTGKRGRYKI